MVTQSYKIKMIAMTDHPVSVMYQRNVLPSWKKNGYKVDIFEAVTPKDLVYKTKLEFGQKSERDFTSTEKAVWYSHFELWCECYNNGPLVIVEHDSLLVKPLPDMSKEGYKFLSYLNRDFGEKGIHIAPGSGYYLTPNAASRLIAAAVSKPIRQNSDGHLASTLSLDKQIKMNDYCYIEQVNYDGLNTIDHRNPNRKFVGLDYENFDIPGLHGQTL